MADRAPGWERWLRADHIKLHAGEMTAGELRAVQAVVRAMLAELRQHEECQFTPAATPSPDTASHSGERHEGDGHHGGHHQSEK